MLIRFDPAKAVARIPPACRGDEAWCQGFSEPDAGSDLASLRCRAVASDDGWVLNGQKVWTSLAHLSTHCFVLARTGGPDSGHRGLSMFLVGHDTPGMTVRPLRAMNGRYEFGEVFLDDVALPSDAIIGAPGQGWAMAMYLLQWERGMYAWQRQALMHQRLGQLVAEAGGAADPAALGATWATVATLRALSRDTVRRLAAGESPGPEISVTKVLLARAEQLLMDSARDALVPRLELDPSESGWRAEWFYSRATSIYGGTAEIQRSIIAERCLGLPREPARGR
jgi:alkylation response protein AidB-like acyl-CoA dehydrogenase